MAPVRTTEEYAQMGWREFHALLEPYERIGIHKCTSDEDVRYYLELIFQEARRDGKKKPDKNMSMTCAIRAGQGWTSQSVGAWFSRRQKEHDGKPKLQQKTPAQIIILERAFAAHPYISELETRDLVYELGGLSRKQIAAWFCQQRKTRSTYEDYEERDWMNRDLARNPEMSFKTHPISKSRKAFDKWFEMALEGDHDMNESSWLAWRLANHPEIRQ